jgi:hypothetical protein
MYVIIFNQNSNEFVHIIVNRFNFISVIFTVKIVVNNFKFPVIF